MTTENMYALSPKAAAKAAGDKAMFFGEYGDTAEQYSVFGDPVPDFVAEKLPEGFDPKLLDLPKGNSNTPFEELKDLSNKDQVSWIFQNIDVADDELSDEPQSWLVDQMLLEHGLHLFSGKPGSMKSLLALMLCKATCSSESFLGRKNLANQ